MKKYAVGLVFALLGAAGLVGFNSVSAKNPTIAEKFANTNVAAESGVYNFDMNHSAIGFQVKHMGLIYVPGYFTDFSGAINYNADDDSKSSVEFTAKTASVDTRVERRNKHLRTADFFDVETYPEMTFKSTKVAKSGDMLMVTGDFTLRGVTKSITIPVKVAGFADSPGGKVMGAMSETTIDRTDYGVNYDWEGRVVSKDVKVILNIEAKQAK
ncbi:MAG: YceI family protein [Acidobacteria bacterium]|nr:YceI family protein [Acidobacteriota bacterium]